MKRLIGILVIALLILGMVGCTNPTDEVPAAETPIGERISDAIEQATENSDNYTADIKIELLADGRESAKIYIELNGGTDENYSNTSDYSISYTTPYTTSYIEFD